MFLPILFPMKRACFVIPNVRPWIVAPSSSRYLTNNRLLVISNPKFSNETKSHQKRHASRSGHVPLAVRIIDSASLSFQPYLRIMRLNGDGKSLILLPILWGSALPFSIPHTLLHVTHTSASLGLTSLGFDPFVYLALTVWAVAMHSTGCIVNDYFDRDIDARVERTRNRPLASGQITPFSALLLFGGTLSLAFSAALTLNWYCVFHCTLNLPLVIAYPLFKRVTYWPQLMLGIACNYGVLIGFASIAGHCDWSMCLPLYAAGIAWTLVCDTIYAHQDRKDDARVGVKSTALLFPTPRASRRALTAFATAMVSCLSLTAYTAGLHWPFYAAIAGTALHFGWQIRTLDINNADNCLERFKSNRSLGLLLLLGIISSNLIETS